MVEDTIHELAVRVTPKGTDETQSALENTREEFGSTTDEVGESTSLLTDFNKTWVGAGLVFAGTMGTLTAAIASRMPILKEIAAGMDQVLTSLALAIDEDVRPSLSNLTDDLSDLSNEIDEADSSAEALGKTIRGLGEIGVNIAFAFQAETQPEGGKTKRERIQEQLEDFMEGLTGFDIPIQVDLLPNFSIDGVLESIGFAQGESFIGGMVTGFMEGAPEFLENVLKFMNDVVTGIQTGIIRIEEFFRIGFEVVLNEAKKFLNNLAARFEKRINQILSALSRIPGQDFGQVSIGRFETRSTQAIGQAGRARIQRRVAGARDTNQQRDRDIERLVAELQGAERTTEVQINGRTVAGAIVPELGRGVANRGR